VLAGSVFVEEGLGVQKVWGLITKTQGKEEKKKGKEASLKG